MATKQHAQRMAQKLGARLLINPDCGQAELVAPRGQRWRASGGRAFCVNEGDRECMALVYDELVEAMRDGMADAPYPTDP